MKKNISADNKPSVMRRIFAVIAVCVIFAAAMFILHHNIGNAWVTTNYEPGLTDTPVYVEFSKNAPLKVEITPDESFTVNGLRVVLVNISEDSHGTLHTSLKDSSGKEISSSVDALSEITVGGWYGLAISGELIQGETYTVTFSVDDGNPYFMSLDQTSGDSFPYTLKVCDHGNAYISMGIERVDITARSFGDVFYFSIPICVLLFIFFLVWAIMGSSLFTFLKKIPIRTFITRYGNVIFLILVYITICLSIFSRGYVQSVFISSDSAGYLREAANLMAGNGFSYDGLAGYDTWFASWPILYPLMIAAVALITHTDVYLASKLLSMLLVLLILLVIYFYAGRNAWVYSLALLNTGFITLTQYTWSELPFMLFIMCFGLILGKIVSEKDLRIRDLILLGIMTAASFLTRYYGLFEFFVLGLFILYFFVRWLENREVSLRRKWIGLLISSAVSGSVCMAYLVLNKLMNGMASGVSRTMWWDDYGILTDDLITSLTTEFFHIFSLETPDLITGFPIQMQVLVLFIILAVVFAVILRPLKAMDEHSVWIIMSLVYYVVFICIRYVSSMDSFYFRFFEPATFLLTLGVVGFYAKEHGERKKIWPGMLIASLVCLSGISVIYDGGLSGKPYYEELTASWDEAYADIPERSVVIFSDLDFRSSYYRPDVVEGTIDPATTLEGLQNTYYGSDQMCIGISDAEDMIAEPIYQTDVEEAIKNALAASSDSSRYISIPLR